jgi:hypothetical protein
MSPYVADIERLIEFEDYLDLIVNIKFSRLGIVKQK